MRTSQFSHTGILMKFILRRDRIRMSIWLFSFVFVTCIVAYAFTDLYGTEQERQGIAATMKNPAMTAMVGKGYGMDNYTIGAMMAHQMFLFTAITVAIMSILFVTRHTRTDEEVGRIEIIRALPTGRLSNLSGTLLTITGMNILLALLIGGSLYVLQIDSIDFIGSFLYGAGLGAVGIFFAVVTAVFAQMAENARSATGLSFAVLGIAYILRAVGDVGAEWLSWISPLGWMLHTEVFVNNYWWPLALLVGAACLLAFISFYLQSIRDIGAGLLPAKQGRTHAHACILHPFGLAIKLQRTGIIAWLIGMVILGVSYGSVLGDLESFFSDNDMMQQLLQQESGGSLTEQFIAMLFSIMAMISTIPAVIVLLKLKGEEQQGRAEHFFSRAISRNNIFGSYVLLSLIIGVLALFCSIGGLWLAGNFVMDDMMSFPTMIKGMIVYVPAMWTIIGLTALFIGIAPSWTGVAWVYLGYAFVVVYLGGLLQFPQWLEKASPFGYVPQVPLEDIDLWKFIVLTFIAGILIIGGFIGYRKRDLQGL